MRSFARPLLTSGAVLIALLSSSLGAATSTGNRAAAATASTLSVAYTSNFPTFDPTQAYTDDWWLINGTIFNGLYQFDRNGKPQLNLAAAPPVVSKDLKTWTFKIRPARFSNGMPVTAEDFKFSITRTLDPHLKPAVSWGQTTDAVYVGAQDFIAGKAKGVSGIQVVDAHTIRFVLAQPVAVLPYLLASTYNFVTPEAVYAKETPDQIATHPIGAGPYMLQSWQRGNEATLVKNPYYFKPGLPRVGTIIAYEKVPANIIALRVQKGELDGFGNDQEVDAADLHQMQANPQYAKFIVTAGSAAVIWLDLNTKVAPLDNAKVRQAIAMAISRRRMVQLLGGGGIPAYQMYIPLDAQHDPALDASPIYPYDPGKAQTLLKASGYHNQPITVLYANDEPYYAAMAPGILQELSQIGLNVSLRGVSENSLLTLAGPLTGHQINFDLWSMDYPDGYDVYTGAMSCGVNIAGSYIGAKYCDSTADNLVSQAENLPLGAARDALLRKAQVKILTAAAEIPLVFEKSIEIVNPRVKGFYYQPAFGWQFENYSL